MKLKGILLLAVVALAFLMIASASASDDAQDNLTAENKNADLISEDNDGDTRLVVDEVS